jgi:hypothetical protein
VAVSLVVLPVLGEQERDLQFLRREFVDRAWFQPQALLTGRRERSAGARLRPRQRGVYFLALLPPAEQHK